MRRTRLFKPVSPGGPFYVFLTLPQPDFASYDEYREFRGGLLEACLMVAKHIFPDALDIVGIASEPVRPDSGSSEDLLYLDAREWTKEMDEEAAQLQKEFGILTSTTLHHSHVKEYPEQESNVLKRVEKRKKVGRNEQCPCGSGKKYKYCHGRKS